MNLLLLFFIHFFILIFIIGYIMIGIVAIGDMETPTSRKKIQHQKTLYDIQCSMKRYRGE